MKKNMEIDKGQIVLYKNRFEVRLKAETVWLTSHQIADLFDVDRTGVVRHIHNIYKTKELHKISTCAKNAQVAKDGKIRSMDFYNLDMIISVGYKVSSTRATQFRVWATDILKKHLIEGYTINEKRLKQTEIKYQELQKAVALIGNVLEVKDLPAEAKGLVEVITEYTKALDILDDFDHQRLDKPKGRKHLKYKLTYDKAKMIINTMRRKFKDSAIMGQEKDESFKSSIGAIYQTFGGKDLYATIEEKAAHLLYFITKNHSFVDGNKRIAAAIFVCFLDKNGILHKKDSSCAIDNNALVALTLMIASSKPAEKDVMIKVILNILGRR
jgi:prophage maintenance system killer protein/phage regulator Rha-like protein